MINADLLGAGATSTASILCAIGAGVWRIGRNIDRYIDTTDIRFTKLEASDHEQDRTLDRHESTLDFLVRREVGSRVVGQPGPTDLER